MIAKTIKEKGILSNLLEQGNLYVAKFYDDFKGEWLELSPKTTGFKNKAEQYISKSDIFVLTSKFEGLPNVLLEAQLLKKYIISTKCPTGPNEILLNGKAGDLIKIGDYKKMAEKIKYYINNKKKLKNKIKVGYKNLNRFDYNYNMKQYSKIISKFIYF